MKLLLIVRNAAAQADGSESSNVAEIMKPEARCSYPRRREDRPWPIFFMADNEIVAGRKHKHMDSGCRC